MRIIQWEKNNNGFLICVGIDFDGRQTRQFNLIELCTGWARESLTKEKHSSRQIWHG